MHGDTWPATQGTQSVVCTVSPRVLSVSVHSSGTQSGWGGGGGGGVTVLIHTLSKCKYSAECLQPRQQYCKDND